MKIFGRILSGLLCLAFILQLSLPIFALFQKIEKKSGAYEPAIYPSALFEESINPWQSTNERCVMPRSEQNAQESLETEKIFLDEMDLPNGSDSVSAGGDTE